MTMKESNEPVASRIREIAREKGFRHEAIAARSGLNKQQFSYLLNGRRTIKPCDIVAVAKALGVNVSELFESET